MSPDTKNLVFKPVYIYVVVNFLSQVISMFPLFFGMVMYANEVETKKNIKITWDKKLTTTYIYIINNLNH